jgi:hypothetical protein
VGGVNAPVALSVAVFTKKKNVEHAQFAKEKPSPADLISI